MKRIVFTALIALWMVLNSYSLFAAEDEWICSECGVISTGNYCSNCGAEKPSGKWKCPNCGGISSGNFCSNCGTSRTTSLPEDGRSKGIEYDTPEEEILAYLNDSNEGVATEATAEEASLGSWENNLLMEEHGALGELKANGSTPEAKQYIFDNVKWDRRAVKGIYVLDTVSAAPDDAYDISESKNRSVLGWIDDHGVLYIAGEGGVRAPENSAALFAWFENVQTIDLSNLHTDYMNDCRYMFYHCYNLETLVLTGFRTDNATKMIKMFTECRKLENLNLGDFRTDNVNNFFAMFQKCESLRELDLTGFNTGNSKNFGLMFFDCTSLEQVQWNPQIFTTEKVKNMRSMFHNCLNLKYVDISGFSMNRVEDTSYMFLNCESLQATSNFKIDLTLVESHEDMFAGSSVEDLYGRNGEYLQKSVDNQAGGKEPSASRTPMSSEQGEGARGNTRTSVSDQKSNLH